MLRRTFSFCVILAFPILAAVPALAHPVPAKQATQTYVTRATARPTLQKGKKQTKGTTRTKKSGKARKSTKTRPKAVATARPHNTPTLTATPTNTPTPTPTPVPTPSVGELAMSVDMARGYSAAFTVCGLPNGVTASFLPNPAYPAFNSASVPGGRASTTLDLVAPYTVPPGSYLLAVHPYFEDVSGNLVQEPPYGYTMNPQSVLLTIGDSGGATLAPSDEIAAVGTTHCSPLPDGYTMVNIP